VVCYDVQMKQAILITAVSGSGKSTVCRALKSLGYTAYDIETVDGLFQWRDDKTGQPVLKYHDDIKLAKGASWICDKKSLKELIDNEPSDLSFYCGAGSNINEIWDLFDQVVVLQVSDKTTVKRLSGRGPDEFGHNPEVRKYVLSWKDEVEKKWLQKGGIAIEAEDSPRQIARHVVDAVTS